MPCDCTNFHGTVRCKFGLAFELCAATIMTRLWSKESFQRGIAQILLHQLKLSLSHPTTFKVVVMTAENFNFGLCVTTVQQKIRVAETFLIHRHPRGRKYSGDLFGSAYAFRSEVDVYFHLIR